MISPPLSEMQIDYISQLPLPLAGDIRLSPLMIAQSKGSQTPPVATMYCVMWFLYLSKKKINHMPMEKLTQSVHGQTLDYIRQEGFTALMNGY